MVSSSVLVVSAVAAIVRAQTIVTSSAASVAGSTTVSQVMPPVATASFNIGNVTATDKFNWCHAQLNTCPQICGGAAAVNFCDQNALTYTCTCPNGTVPDCTAFENTLPFFICEATFSQCINNNPNNAEGQSQCTTNEQCGTRNATAEAIAATSASEMATSTMTSAAASSGGSSASQTASQSAASASSSGVAASNNQHVATGATAALLLAAVRLFL